MSNISVDYDVLNQRGSPAWFTDTFANIPTAGYVGRMFISKDTFAFYRDTGTGWDLIGGPGIGTLTGSGVVGQVSFFNGTQVLAGNNNLFWNNTNSRLGINTATPGAPLDIHGTGTLIQVNGTGVGNGLIAYQQAGASKWTAGNFFDGTLNTFAIYNVGLVTNALTISSTTNNVNFGSTIGNGTYTYTLPSATGTLALTSDLTAYVTLAGAQTITGAKTFNDYQIFTNAISANSGIAFLNGVMPPITSSNYSGIGGNSQGVSIVTRPVSTNFTNNLNFAASDNTFTFPNATGTLALTSDLSAYLPLAGGTLTGALIGTSATFSGAITLSGNGTQANNTITTLSNGYMYIDGNTNGLILENNNTSSTRIRIEAADNMQFQTASTERMRITSAGNVGIGNSNPSVLLTIGTTQTSPVATADVTLGLNRYILWGTNGSGAGTVRSWGIANNELVAGDFVIKSSSTNNNTLDTVRFQITNAGVVTISALGTGTVTATSGTLSTVSDMNLKIADGFIYNALEKVLKLTPRYFYWKEESNLPTNLRQLGFYAQEVNEAIGEEAANTPKNDINWGINDRAVIAMLTKAIQELNEKLIKNNIN